MMQSTQFVLGPDLEQCKEGPHDTLPLFHCPAKLIQLTPVLLWTPIQVVFFLMLDPIEMNQKGHSSRNCYNNNVLISANRVLTLFFNSSTSPKIFRSELGRFGRKIERYSVEARWADDDCTILFS